MRSRATWSGVVSSREELPCPMCLEHDGVGHDLGVGVHGGEAPDPQLPTEEWAHAKKTLAAAYGAGRKMSERVVGGPRDMGAYIEITSGR